MVLHVGDPISHICEDFDDGSVIRFHDDRIHYQSTMWIVDNVVPGKIIRGEETSICPGRGLIALDRGVQAYVGEREGDGMVFFFFVGIHHDRGLELASARAAACGPRLAEHI